MEIEFDPVKDRENIRKHGISLSAAKDILWDEAISWPDDRFEYDELRMIAIAPIENKLYYIVYVERGDAVRIISIRDANRKDIKNYERNY